MKTVGFLALALSAGLILITGSAAAQQMCAPRDQLVSNLGKSYSEVPTGRGLSAKGNLVELLTGKNGSWTMLLTRPSGHTCVIGAGEAWHDIEPHMASMPGPVS